MSLDDSTRRFYEALGRCLHNEALQHLRVCAAMTANTPLAPAFVALQRFAHNEQLYTSIGFLRKGLFKRDSLSLTYTTVLDELQRMARECATAPLPASVNADFFADLFRQTCTLINVRQKLIATYRLLAGSPSSLPDYRLLVVSLEVLLDTNRAQFPHPCLALLRLGFLYETSVLICLFKAQTAIGAYEFKEATALLFKNRSYLDQWRTRIFPPVPEPGTKAAKGAEVFKLPNTYCWLSELHGQLVAKETLYFYNILGRHEAETGEADMRAQFARTEYDFYDAIRVFHRRTDAINISLLFHVTGSEPFRKDGYTVPSAQAEVFTGLNSFQCIFSHPAPTTPPEHKPNVIMIIQDKDEDISLTRDGPYKFQDTKAHATYFIARLDPSVFFIVIYGERAASKESAIVEFFTSICSVLRSTNLYDKLNRY